MTREEVIDLLKKDKSQRGDCFLSDALDIAIKTLEQEPFINKACVSINVCKHDKEVALNKIKAEIKRNSELFINKDYVELKQKPEREGHWIDNQNGTISCSSCQTWFHKDDRYSYMHYCPNCKTKMKEGER